MFKIGQKVKVIDGLYQGEVINIEGNMVSIQDDYGLSYSFRSEELIVDKMGEHQIQVSKKQLKPTRSKRTVSKSTSNQQKTIIVDLHSNKIKGIHSGLSKHEIYQRQLDLALDYIEKWKRSNRQSLVLIHGNGKGKLKKGIEQICHQKGLTFTQASFHSFGEGAIEILRY